MPYLKSISRDACNPQGRAQVIIDVLNRSIAGMLYYLPMNGMGRADCKRRLTTRLQLS